MEENNVVADNSNTAEEVVLETTEEITDNSQNETVENVEELKSKLAKAEELASNYKVRSEKAEKLAKQVKEPTQTETDTLSTLDAIALVKANVHEDDISEVQDYARLKKMSIKDALKSNIVKALLKEKEETRTTANVTNVSNTKRGVTKLSNEAILRKASEGQEVPIEDVVKARWEEKRKK
jgi:predicted polyphosphate/ATP-dependent NAD kinase